MTTQMVGRRLPGRTQSEKFSIAAVVLEQFSRANSQLYTPSKACTLMRDIIRVVKNKLYRVYLPFGHLGIAQSRRKVTKLTQLEEVQFAGYQESTGPF
jgi:hypothetical protein